MLIGRLKVVASIDEWANLVDQARDVRALRHIPIIQLVGPPYSGKTEVLVAQAQRYSKLVPVAWHDFAHDRAEVPAHEILKLLVFTLSGPREGFGQLTFPRLLAALIAIERPLPSKRGEAVQEIERALEDPASIERITRYVTAFAADAAKLVQVPPGGGLPGGETMKTLAPDLVLAALRRSKRGRRKVSPLVEQGLGPWPGMTSASLPETLVDINFNMKSEDPLLRSMGEAQPWAAFLEDLRANYSGRAGRGRNLCSLLFLDNIDSPKGRTFVQAFADARARRASEGGDVDPLLVVCAARQSVSLPKHPGAIETIHLPDLTLTEVQDIAVALAVPAVAASAEVVHALTAGHKGGARHLLASSSRRSSYSYEIFAGSPAASGIRETPSPGTELRQRLLPDVTDSEYEILVTCSPMIDIGQAEVAVREGKFGLPKFDLLRQLGELGWLDTASIGPLSQIHPMIRNLLLYELGRRSENHGWSWIPACQWFQDHPPPQIPGVAPDSVGTVNHSYYDLVIGNMSAAMKALEKILVETPRQWVSAFDWIVAAPHANGVWHEPRPLVHRLASAALEGLPPDDAEGDPGSSPVRSVRAQLAELLVARWLASGRQFDPWHELDQIIARGYEAVAPFAGGEEFYRRAQQYRDSAQWWSRTGKNAHPRPSRSRI